MVWYSFVQDSYLIGLVYLSLFTDNLTYILTRLYKTVWEGYGNNLSHVRKLFSAYFHTLSMIAYENSLTLLYLFFYRNSLYIDTYIISAYTISDQLSSLSKHTLFGQG